jgi:diguanylate cyclase (GGDEF)-like protein/PAS domain S-box-containing protein
VLVSNFSTIGIVMVTVLVLVVAMVSAEVDRQVSRFESALWSSTRGNRQLDQHNKRLQAAFRAGGAGIWECNLENGLSYVDESLQALLGILRSDGPVGLTSWRSRVHPDDLGIFDAKWSASLGSGDKYENEYRIVNRAGEVRWVRSVASIVRSESGSAQRVVGMTWDVTAERAREQQTADLAKRFHMTLEAIGDAVISTDEHRRIVYVNRAASQIVGWEAEECIGRPLQEVFITRDERSGALRGDPIQRCIDGGGLLLAEDGVLISRTGTRHNIRKHIALMDEGNAAVLTFQDITDARRMALELTHAATHDALTGLANRAAFEKGLRRLWEDSHDSSRTHCVCLLDLDRFKIINDTSGHLAGDALLREIAGVLKTSLRATDLAARMGGDEFLLLLADTSTEAAKACMSRVLESVSALRFPWHGRVYEVTASIGLATFDCSSPEPEVLVSQADVALFTAKRQGRNQIAVYSRDSGVALSDHLEMQVAADLKNGIDEGRFELHAQAIVSPCAVHDARYFELLLRMRDKSGKLIPPCDFIPAAERYGLMATIDRWVIRTALDAIRNHHAEELGFRFAINLSAASLSDPTLWDFVSEQFLRTGVQPSSITFEVTETGVIQHFEHAKEFMFKARMAGCPIALDDFGTGLSSLSYLKEFSVDTIKIDGSFIRNMADSVLDQAIVRSVAEVARSMKATTVAECVEDLATLNALKLLEVDLVQGWAIGKPVPLGDVLASPGEDRGADSTAGGLFLVERGAA